MDESSRLCVLTPHSSIQVLLPHRNGATTGRRCCHQVRGIGSKGAVLVNVWTFLFVCGINPVYFEVFQNNVDKETMKLCVYGFSAMILIGPIAGLLASIYFGRYKALQAGLWLMWAGNVVTCCDIVIQHWISVIVQLSSGFMIIAIIASSIGFALFISNSVPFGLDQMPDASGEQITAFIFWYTWSFMAGLSIVMIQGAAIKELDSLEALLFLSLFAVALLSVTLCSKFLLRGWLIIEPKGINPLKTFYGVLRFAAKHKIPVRRSAFTYWEEVKPSRLDLAKIKYGGPYTHEEVEDIKTCLRMVVVIASISVTMTAFGSHELSRRDTLENEFISNSTTSNPRLLIESAGSLVVILGFPIYEVFVHPLTKKWIPSTLRRVGWSLMIIVIASLLLLVSTTVWYVNTNPSICMFDFKRSTPFQVDLNWIEVPHSILIFTFFFLVHAAMLEFICAQAPYILRGLLIGLGYSVVLFSCVVGAGVYIVWRVVYQEKAPNSPSCGVWFHLFTTITATLGCVLWCAVAKWYKRREREEPDMCRIFAENYYDH